MNLIFLFSTCLLFLKKNLQFILIIWNISLLIFFPDYNEMLAHLPFDASLPVIQEVSSLPHQNISYNFVDVSESQGAFCWKYFLLDKTHFKAKCNVMKNNGKICNQIIATPNSGTKTCNRHLKNIHGIENPNNLVLVQQPHDNAEPNVSECEIGHHSVFGS